MSRKVILLLLYVPEMRFITCPGDGKSLFRGKAASPRRPLPG